MTNETPDIVGRFFVSGRLERSPRRLEDKIAVYAHLARRVFPEHEQLTERQLMDRLTPLAHDPIAVRRAWVEWGMAGRERDGSLYWLIPEGLEGPPA